MKLRNIFPVVLCILIGFFMGNFMFSQYNKNTEEVLNTGEKLYFLQAGVYSNIDSMKDAMKDFSYYIYTKENNVYYAYVGIIKTEENLAKLKGYFKDLGYDIYVKEVFVSNVSFSLVLEQYEMLLKETTDKKIIASICNQILSKYEELVMVDKD